MNLILRSFVIAVLLAIHFAGTAKATPEQDYAYFHLLIANGMEITSPVAARNLGYAICGELAAGRNWRLIVTELMTGGDWKLKDASAVMATAVAVYCPAFDPMAAEEGQVT